MDITNIAKNIATVLATGTTLAYVFGYLSLRARSFSLGTDPGFTLVDEAYVFAGVRLLFLVLIVLLLLSPLIALVRSGVPWLAQMLPPQLVSFSLWLSLFVMALITLLLLFKVVDINGLLLHYQLTGTHTLFEEAAMGKRVGVLFMFLIVFMLVVSALWLKASVAQNALVLTWVLGLVVAVQLFLLPMFYGVVYADRKVRVLADVPDKIKYMKQPVGIVDRSSEHITLLGVNQNGLRSLVTIKLDDLNGVGISAIMRMGDFVKTQLQQEAEFKGKSMPENIIVPDKVPSELNQERANFFSTLINYLQMSFEAIGSLGFSEVDYGQIWSFELGVADGVSNAHKITDDSAFSWPVYDINHKIIYAIQGNKIVKLKGNGSEILIVNAEKHWIKLFGLDAQGNVLAMHYENDENYPALLQSDGKIVNVVPSNDQQQRLAMLLQEGRTYTGNQSLYVQRSERGGRGYDVFYKKGTEVINISNCGDDKCGQPSLSPDSKKILFIRKSRY